MPIEGVIFDFNGVLVWDGDLHERAWSDTAQAMRGAPLSPAELRDQVHGRPNRDILTYLAAFAWQRQQDVTDTLVELLIKMIKQVTSKAERSVEREVIAEMKRIANKNGVLRKLAEAAVAHPDGVVSEVIYPVVGEQTLKDLVVELNTTERFVERAVQGKIRRSYGHHYRQMVVPILELLTFRSTNPLHQPVIDALGVIVRAAGQSDTTFVLDGTIPLEGVVPAAWREQVIERDAQGVEHIRRVPYEICVLQRLREQLRCKAIWVEGARRYRNPEEDVPQDFAQQREVYYSSLGLPLDAAAFLDPLRQTMDEALTRLHDGLLTNRLVTISLRRGKGWIGVTPLSAQPEPFHLGQLKGVIGECWPTTSLLDMLKEDALRTRCTDCFSSLTVRENLSPEEVDLHLLAVERVLVLGGSGGDQRDDPPRVAGALDHRGLSRADAAHLRPRQPLRLVPPRPIHALIHRGGSGRLRKPPVPT